MKGGHTPGPWTARGGSLNTKRWFVDALDSKRFVATMDGPQDSTGEANARLIAAAPELLDALEESLGLRLVGTNNPNIGDDQILPVEVTMGELRRARAAIAKARGET